MAQLGVNVDKTGASILAKDVAWLSARWARVVAAPDHVMDQLAFVRALTQHGIKVLLCFDQDAYRTFGDPAALDTWRQAANWGKAVYRGLIHAIEPTNEPDGEGHESSAEPVECVNGKIQAHRETWGADITLVGVGSVSGQASYYENVRVDLLDALSIHPYAQWTPESLNEMLDHHAALGLPLWITEVGLDADDARQAEFLTWTLETIKRRPEVQVCTWFCAHHYGAWGMIRDNGSWRPSADAFRRVAESVEEPTVTVKAIDVSSHQPTNLTSIIQQHQPKHVISKLYMPWESISFDHTAQQIASARANGCTVGGYVWAYRSQDPIATIDAVITRCASIDLVLPLLWIDCETYHGSGGSVDPGPDADWLSKAVDHAERVYEMKCGIYTGIWWIDGHFPGGQAEFSNFARLPIWLSQYDGNTDINSTRLPMGWTEAACKQYRGTGIDLNSIRPEYTVYEGGGTEPDPCENLHRQIQEWINTKPFKAPSKKKLKALVGTP